MLPGSPTTNKAFPNRPIPLSRQDGEEAAPKVTDDELIFRQLFAQDARQGCALLFRRYYANLVNNAVRLVYSKEVAEDLVAEVFTVFWQEAIYKQINTSYRAYLYKAVRYRAYNYIRWELHKSDSLDLSEDQFMAASLQPDQMLHFSELYQKIEAVIQGLPPQCQRAFLLSRIEGKRYAEIAQELQVSQSAVEKLIMRAIGKLRHELKADWLITLLSWLSIAITHI